MKNYIAFVNDHSGSMGHLARGAISDYNTQINAIKDASSREMLDTVVSVAEAGGDARVTVMVSNPHVLRPVTSWQAKGGTPLYDAVGHMMAMLLTLPDAQKQDVSFLVIVTTDGEETGSPTYPHARLGAMIKEAMKTGRWSFVFRVPTSIRSSTMNEILDLGIPEGNIQKWETTLTGLAESTKKNTAAVDAYFTQRSAGVRATSAFYADASKVDITALEDISGKVSLYVVPQEDNGIEIRPFILKHRMEHLKGSAFYQLTKTEARVQHDKLILVRDRASGKIFSGKQARSMIGLPNNRNARLHPGDHKNFDLFIQSNSVNRKLVGGTGVVYWKEIGVPFTEADLAYLQPKPTPAPQAPAVVVLPAVPVSTAPTKSPIPVTPRKPAEEYFATREEARLYAASIGKVQSAIVNRGPAVPRERRWAVPA
jgi:hypothetical protein